VDFLLLVYRSSLKLKILFWLLLKSFANLIHFRVLTLVGYLRNDWLDELRIIISRESFNAQCADIFLILLILKESRVDKSRIKTSEG
jgi:hypothetical protein